jgi:hypothetical protein
VPGASPGAGSNVQGGSAATPSLTVRESVEISATNLVESHAHDDKLPELIVTPVNEESIIAKVEKAIEDAENLVASLERGMWVQFEKRDGSQQRVRLAWVSPMRSLFIFTSSQKEKSFSVAVDELERNFREARAQIVSVDNVVDKALLDALNKPPAEENTPALAI